MAEPKLAEPCAELAHLPWVLAVQQDSETVTAGIVEQEGKTLLSLCVRSHLSLFKCQHTTAEHTGALRAAQLAFEMLMRYMGSVGKVDPRTGQPSPDRITGVA